MRVALYFGSFNPIHIGHLIIANHVLNEGLADKIWFVVSPQNPFKPTHTLLNEYQRLHLVHLAIENDDRMKVSDIEFSLPKPSYTSVTLAHLQEKHPGVRFSIVMGGDSFQNLPKWKNAGYITGNYEILVYSRPGFETSVVPGAKINLLNAPLLEISASGIRELIATGKSVRYMLPEKVEEEIEKAGYYKTSQKK